MAPERIEQVYLQSPLINQIFVDGSSFRSYPAALVVPDGGSLCKIMNDLGQESTSSGATRKNLQIKNQSVKGDSEKPGNFYLKGKLTLADLCDNSEAEQLVLNEILKLGKNAGLKGFEQVSEFTLCGEVKTHLKVRVTLFIQTV